MRAMSQATYAPGALVKVRGREWVVLPESQDELLMLRPLGGVDDEVTGICTAIEEVAPATFSLPDPERAGDFATCRLLRDAARLCMRSAAGPFRAFGKIAVEPRPYQLVPLMMAMRLDPIRMLIADDVGIGKTIESCLIAREMLDRGEVTRFAILCPPHLAEQWQRELSEKFHLESELVLSSTVRRLERICRVGESLFDRHPHVIVSTDFIKSPRRRDDFIRACPELVIVDEAHACTLAGQKGRSRQERHDLVKALSEDESRHLILVTATPHSGNENAFRSLLGLLQSDFANIPTDLDGPKNETFRRRLAQHIIQRRRADIRDYLGGTQFPVREDAEKTYALTPEYRRLFQKVFKFASEIVQDESGGKRYRRVRWWSALALLRSLASSPAAAAATLRNRAIAADAVDEAEVDEIGRQAVLDLEDVDTVTALDFAPGADTSVLDSSEDDSTRKRLLGYARDAESLMGDHDPKLQGAAKIVTSLLKDRHNPIVFCRFIPTAEYVAEQLRSLVKKNVEVISVTGELPPAEREDRIAELGEHEHRVLVCTDCLSEGINLQNQFDAVIHYDLPWNPTRLEQREGRVDRFGQPSEKVRVVTYFGKDNQIDGVVLDVLIRKHKKIRSQLGVSVAVPANTEEVIGAIFQGVQLREGPTDQLMLDFSSTKSERESLHTEWENRAENEKKTRSRYAQHAIKVDEVAQELEAVRQAIGTGPAVERFVAEVLHLSEVPVTPKRNEVVHVDLEKCRSRALRDAVGQDKAILARFDLPVDDGVLYLSRTHPFVEGLASLVLDSALDELQSDDDAAIARRCGLIKTRDVTAKTSVLLVRMRYHIHHKRRGQNDKALLAEEVVPLAFEGPPSNPSWLDEATAEAALSAVPCANVPTALAKAQIENLVKQVDQIDSYLSEVAKARGDQLLDAHIRVRKSAKAAGQVTIEPVLPVDLLGCFILLPDAKVT